MRKSITFIFVLAFALTACAPKADEPVTSPSYPNASYPNSSEPNQPQQNSVIPNDYAPQQFDESLTRGDVFLDFKEVISQESSPLQFTLHLTGSLPTPCSQLRIAVSPPDIENKVLVEAYSVSNPDRICTQVIAPFDVNIPLGSFPTGKYTLWINLEMVAEFQS